MSIGKVVFLEHPPLSPKNTANRVQIGAKPGVPGAQIGLDLRCFLDYRWAPFGADVPPIWGSIATACAFFEDDIRARPVLCKHLPSVWAQFELPIWGSIATACAFFEDDFRARPVLCKHLPSVWAQFELCLGLIYGGLDVFSEQVTYMWRPFGGDLARCKVLICEGLDVLCEPAERMRHPFGDDLVRHFGVSCDGRRVFCEPTGPQR